MNPRLAVVLALSFLVSGAATAQDAAKPAAPPARPAPAGAAQPFRLGALELGTLHDADFPIANDGKTFGIGEPPAAVSAVLVAAGQPGDKIPVSVDALLVKLPGRVVLIDTGLGNPAASGLVASLKLAGVTPEQVTDVLISHSHFDHVGGLLTPDKKPAFPNAKVRMSAKEWAFMQAAYKAAATVIAAQVEPFEPGAVIAPGITAVGLEGHTPGHSGYEIVSGKARLMAIGDTAHSSIVSLAKPDWIVQFDSDQAQGRATRRATLAKLAASGEWVFAPHFPYPGVGHVVAAGDGFIWKPGLP